MGQPLPKPVHSIYHAGPMGNFKQTIRLNLQAIRDLLGRDIAHFDVLTPEDRKELEYRFMIYCMHGQPDFNQGEERFDVQPAINNLPNVTALLLAKAVQYDPSL